MEALPMRKTLLIAMSIALYTLTPASLFSAGKPRSCGADVTNLKLTISGTPTADMGYQITSDGGGTYSNINGKGNKITMGFQISNCSYDFTMNLFQSSRDIHVSLPGGNTTAWFFNFDRIGSVPITQLANSLYVDWCAAPLVTERNEDGTFNLNADDKPFDNYAGCGFDGGGYYALRNVGFALADNFGLRFQVSPFEFNNGLAAGTSYVKVYHPSPTLWVFEPLAPSLSVLFFSPNSGGPSQVGPLISMPFRMQLDLQ
jgi:hypothetical protein